MLNNKFRNKINGDIVTDNKQQDLKDDQDEENTPPQRNGVHISIKSSWTTIWELICTKRNWNYFRFDINDDVGNYYTILVSHVISSNIAIDPCSVLL